MATNWLKKYDEGGMADMEMSAPEPMAPEPAKHPTRKPVKGRKTVRRSTPVKAPVVATPTVVAKQAPVAPLVENPYFAYTAQGYPADVEKGVQAHIETMIKDAIPTPVYAKVDYSKITDRNQIIDTAINQILGAETDPNKKKQLQTLLRMTNYMENKYGEADDAWKNKNVNYGFTELDKISIDNLFKPKGDKGNYTKGQKNAFEYLKNFGLPTDQKQLEKLLLDNDPLANMAVSRLVYATNPNPLPDMNDQKAVFNYWLNDYNHRGAIKHHNEDELFKIFQEGYNKYNSPDYKSNIYVAPDGHTIVLPEEQSIPNQDIMAENPTAQAKDGGWLSKYQSGTTSVEPRIKNQEEFLKNWYENRVIPDPIIQEAYDLDKPGYVQKVSNFPSITYVEKVPSPGNSGTPSSNGGVTGQYNQNLNTVYITPYAQPSVPVHEFTHYIDRLPEGTYMNNIHKDIVSREILPESEVPEQYKAKYSYYTNPEEVHARIMVLRQRAGFKPDEVITKEKLEDFLKNYNGDDENINDILSLSKGIFGLSNLLNYMAVNDSEDNGVRHAKYGGRLSQYQSGSTVSEDDTKYAQFVQTLPNNLKPQNTPDDALYNLRGYWESLGKPSEFDYNQPKESDGYYHAYSRNPNTGEILKKPGHPTFIQALQEDAKVGYYPFVSPDGTVYTFSKDDIIPNGFKTYEYKRGAFPPGATIVPDNSLVGDWSAETKKQKGLRTLKEKYTSADGVLKTRQTIYDSNGNVLETREELPGNFKRGGTTWLNEYQNAGPVKPIIVPPGDPRIQAYRDSMNVYNSYVNLKNALAKQRYIPYSGSAPMTQNMPAGSEVSRKDSHTYTVRDLDNALVNKTLPAQLFDTKIKPAGAQTFIDDDSYNYFNLPDTFEQNGAMASLEPLKRDIRKIYDYSNARPKQQVVVASNQVRSASPVKKVITESGASADVVKKQQQLVDAGYDITVDGAWGDKSQQAWDDYQDKLNSANTSGDTSASGTTTSTTTQASTPVKPKPQTGRMGELEHHQAGFYDAAGKEWQFVNGKLVPAPRFKRGGVTWLNEYANGGFDLTSPEYAEYQYLQSLNQPVTVVRQPAAGQYQIAQPVNTSSYSNRTYSNRNAVQSAKNAVAAAMPKEMTIDFSQAIEPEIPKQVVIISGQTAAVEEPKEKVDYTSYGSVSPQEGARRAYAAIVRDLENDPSTKDNAKNIAKMIMSQAAFETGNWSSAASKANNYSGIKYYGQKGRKPSTVLAPAGEENGYRRPYVQYDSPEDWASGMMQLMRGRYREALHAGTPEEYAAKLKARGYYSGDQNQYAAGVKHYLKTLKFEDGGWLDQYAQGGETFTAGGEKHRVYEKESPTGNGKGVQGHIMVTHPTTDKGKWDTIDLTKIAGAKTVAQGVAATKKWHAENPEYKDGGWLNKYK